MPELNFGTIRMTYEGPEISRTRKIIVVFLLLILFFIILYVVVGVIWFLIKLSLYNW